MPLIRDTIDPRNEREVSDDEALDLGRQGLLLTGTRAKTPEGLRAAAVRQVLANEAAALAAAQPEQAVPAPVDVDEDDDGDQEQQDGAGDTQDPGDDPVSTTDDTPTRTSNQER